MTETTEKAILAGGGFWGMQDLLRKPPWVISTRVDDKIVVDAPTARQDSNLRPRD